MNLNIASPDPLHVLSSTKKFLDNPKHLQFNPSVLEKLSHLVDNQLEKGLESPEDAFGRVSDFEQMVQLIFIEDCINFCFWPDPGNPKWEIKWPEYSQQIGGWYGLQKAFARTLDKNIPILNSDFLADLNLEKVEQIFVGENNIQIPLIKERLEILKDTGEVLSKKYNGQFINVVEQSGYDGIELIKLIIRDFKDYRDIPKINGKDVFFLKRVQLCAADINLYLNSKQKSLKNIEQLTAFADYKIPQMLRLFGLVEYNDDLSRKVDNKILIDQGSLEEIEIRAATVWGVELIRQQLRGKFTSPEIGYGLWLLSQDPTTQSKPYHLTRTIYY